MFLVSETLSETKENLKSILWGKIPPKYAFVRCGDSLKRNSVYRKFTEYPFYPFINGCSFF